MQSTNNTIDLSFCILCDAHCVKHTHRKMRRLSTMQRALRPVVLAIMAIMSTLSLGCVPKENTMIHTISTLLTYDMLVQVGMLITMAMLLAYAWVCRTHDEPDMVIIREGGFTCMDCGVSGLGMGDAVCTECKANTMIKHTMSMPDRNHTVARLMDEAVATSKAKWVDMGGMDTEMYQRALEAASPLTLEGILMYGGGYAVMTEDGAILEVHSY